MNREQDGTSGDRGKAGRSPILTLKEVAEMLKVNQTTLYRLVRRRAIPAFRVGVGGEWRFSLEDVEAWMRQQELAR